MTTQQRRSLRRSRSNRMIAGVCGGLSDFFGISSFWFRLAFVRGNSDQAVLNQAIALAGQQHDQYILELARLLGITPVPGTAVAVPSATPTP